MGEQPIPWGGWVVYATPLRLAGHRRQRPSRLPKPSPKQTSAIEDSAEQDDDTKPEDEALLTELGATD